MHIASWALTIILYVIAFLHISKSQGPTPMFKPLQMALRVFMLLTLFSGFWLLIKNSWSLAMVVEATICC